MRPLVLLLVVAAIARQASAHMELVLPPAVRSKSDPQTAEADKDYSMTSPLEADGSNFPAKKYATKAKLDALKPVATLVAGQEFSWNLGGTAVHNGGSCQVAISYDAMETMVVIASWVGGCPLSLPYKFKVPDLPGCDKCFFIWSWFNRTGNREMYQNAAVVSISGKAKQFVGPQIYRINTFGKGVCSSAEGIDIMFPAPGDQVFYANGMSASSPVTEIDCPDWDNKKTVTVTGPGNGPTATAPSGGATGTTGGSAGSKPAGTSTVSTGTKPSSTASGTAPAGTTASATATGTADTTTSATGGSKEADDGTLSGSGGGVVGTNGGAGSGPTSTSSSSSGGLTDLDSDKTPLLFGGGLALLLAVAAGVYCLVQRRDRRSGYRESSSDDDSERAYSHRRARRSRSPRRHSHRQLRHEKRRHDDTDSSSSESTD
ncbi:hypothetical protein BMF94_6236 [Rhodotorula taiwanensis]|uniref:Uncharacterized protein n=1 Tax=Rhodotorula taiwanensis TaxID=741276 RepID=A0A2S5B209_9BASI|nr:hypothetical protein BMF94_6236 [Rhodotorula taiwanensis]